MAKVFGIHMIELNPGVTPEQFENFITGEGAALLKGQQGKIYLVKGDRGARAGMFASINEYESVEERDRAYPVVSAPAEELMKGLPEETQRLYAKFASLAHGLDDPTMYTDYVVISE